MNLEEIKTKAAEYLSEGFRDPSQFSTKLGEFLIYSFGEYENMDADAKAYADRVHEGIIGMFADGIERLPDGIQRRELLRLIASAQGKHFKAENLAKSLSAAPEYQYPIIQKAEPVFFGILQQLLDVLHDATNGSHSGVARFSAVSLFFLNVDELLVAFHLAQRKYSTQSFSHARNIYENLNKIELFHKEPKWADIWASEDQKAIYRELRPLAVREKLGKPKFDPVYSFFSEVGTHGTFRGVQGRVAKRETKDTGEPVQIGVRVWVGGVPREDQLVISVSACIFAVVSCLVLATEVFIERLNEEEVLHILQAAVDRSADFLKEHFVGWADARGFDVTEMLEAIQKKPSIL
jgi:hypothetical protein